MWKASTIIWLSGTLASWFFHEREGKKMIREDHERSSRRDEPMSVARMFLDFLFPSSRVRVRGILALNWFALIGYRRRRRLVRKWASRVVLLTCRRLLRYLGCTYAAAAAAAAAAPRYCDLKRGERRWLQIFSLNEIRLLALTKPRYRRC